MKTTFRIIGLVAVFIAIGIAGRQEYTEEVMQTVSYEQYTAILMDLGGHASDRKIIEHYLKNKEKFDSLNWKVTSDK